MKKSKGQQYFENYLTWGSTECRTWEQLSPYARLTWEQAAMNGVCAARHG